MGSDRFLVTGAGGCIGAWVLNELHNQGETCFALDISRSRYRSGLLMDEEQLENIHFIEADIRDGDQIRNIVKDQRITHVIHLAGLQVPFCKADPAQGAQVNVLGTVNVFEAVRHCREQIKGVAFASSIAVFGPSIDYPEGPVSEDARTNPGTLYGVYKQANEGTASVYWNDYGISSVGLRPYIVFGVARDQGLTSDLAKAILAATVGQPFTIKFSGMTALQYTRDVALIFIRAAQAEYRGQASCNLQNDSISVEEFIGILKNIFPDSRIDLDSSITLPFPYALKDTRLRSIIGEVPHTPLTNAIQDTSQRFRKLVSEGKIDLKQLET